MIKSKKKKEKKEEVKIKIKKEKKGEDPIKKERTPRRQIKVNQTLMSIHL